MHDQDKCYPRYDDHAHIDSAAIDPPPPKPLEDYTEQYLAPGKRRPIKKTDK